MRSISILVFFTLLPLFVCAQTSKESKWVKVHDDDEGVTIYYNSNITTDKKGRHIVWVKAVYHSEEWQNYFSDQLGIRTPVMTTKTKAMYDDRYCFAMVRQVQCFNKAGKLLYDSGDDSSAGWGFVNASDPVGIVGEYLGELDEKKITSTPHDADVTIDGKQSGNSIDEEKENILVDEEEEIFQVVEEMPEFPGGMDKLLEYLGKNIKYPSDAKEQGIQGRSIIEFVVNKDGSIVDPKVVHSLHPKCDEEAMRVIKTMPKWKPGKQRGKPVRVKYTVPVQFKLSV